MSLAFLRIITFSVISYKHILFPSNSVEIGYLCLIYVEVLATQDFICVWVGVGMRISHGSPFRITWKNLLPAFHLHVIRTCCYLSPYHPHSQNQELGP